MNELELAWETYDFYTSEITKCEQLHTNTIKTLKRFVSENTSPTNYQRKRVRYKCSQSCYHLCLLYRKQIDALSHLIKLHNTYIDIPPERDVDIEYLITLKNTTTTLISQIQQYKQQIEEML